MVENGFEMDANADEQERIILDVAAGKLRIEESTSRLSRDNNQGISK
jgi:prophage maintenance system killer protein